MMGTETTTTSDCAASTSPRCLVLAPAAASVPVELLEGLSRRGMAVAVVSDPPSVMVELARGDAAAVVLVDRERLPKVDTLITAVRRYHPRAMIWSLDRPDEQPSRLNKVNGHHHPVGRYEVNGAPDPSDRSRNGHGHQPSPGGRERRLRGLAVHVPAEREHEPLITAEELEMLLDPSGYPAEVASVDGGDAP